MEKKVSVCLGLNSIVDISNNDSTTGSQKSLFTEEDWRELKYKVYVDRNNLPMIPVYVERKLKEIESVIMEDIRSAYKKCLEYQAEYAFTDDEAYLEVYAHVIRLIQRGKNVMNIRKAKSVTEEDFVGEVWTPIFASVFNDPILTLKWGDTVSKQSTADKKAILQDSVVIGDKVDLRVIANLEGSQMDVLNAEFAGFLGEKKFLNDHVRSLRESKLNMDAVAGSKFNSDWEIRRIILPCFQGTGLDGEVKLMTLRAPGLYTVQLLGFVPIPDNAADLPKLRLKCIPRLMYAKRQALKNAQLAATYIKIFF